MHSRVAPISRVVHSTRRSPARTRATCHAPRKPPWADIAEAIATFRQASLTCRQSVGGPSWPSPQECRSRGEHLVGSRRSRTMVDRSGLLSIARIYFAPRYRISGSLTSDSLSRAWMLVHLRIAPHRSALLWQAPRIKRPSIPTRLCVIVALKPADRAHCHTMASRTHVSTDGEKFNDISHY